MKKIPLLILLLTILVTACKNISDEQVTIIPSPGSYGIKKSFFKLNENTVIAFSDSSLIPLASILQNSFEKLSGFTPELSDGGARENCIELTINKNLGEEEYSLKISDNISIEGRDYGSLAFGVSTLLQMYTTIPASEPAFRHVIIHDKPDSEYRAVMLDLARFWHPAEVVKETIDLLWFYKIRYLQLHLSDNRRMTFPLEKYPDLKTINSKGEREYYLKEELEELVKYASQRGVIIIPEIEIPGHSEQLWQKYPETFGSIDPSTGKPRPLYAVNIAKEETYQACAEIIRSLAKVFHTSPYIHIGGDEVYLENIKKLPEYKSYCTERNLAEAINGNAQELFCHFINRMHEVVKECGRETIIWEGFPGTGAGSESISKDIKVIVWNTTYNHPDTLIAGGFHIINSTWMPWYMVGAMNFAPSTERALNWKVTCWKHWNENIPDIEINDSKSILGGQISFWEQNHFKVIPVLRERVPILSEKLWNNRVEINKSEFLQKRKHTDELYSVLFKPLKISAKELTAANDLTFTDTAYISLINTTGNSGIRYTITANRDLPNIKESKVYTGEFAIRKSCVITAWPVNDRGMQTAYPSQAYFQKIIPTYKYRVFSPAPVKGWESMPCFDSLRLVRNGVSGRMTMERTEKINEELFAKIIPEGHIETRFQGLYNPYAIELKGYMLSPGGNISLKILTHDGLADLYIDQKKVFSGSEFDKKYEEFDIELTEGKHSFTIKYYYRYIQNQLNILYKTKDMDGYKPFENIVMDLEK